MQAVSRPYVFAAAALAATGAMAIAPLANYAASQAPQAPQAASQPRVVHVDTKLVDAESLLNVPLNLFYDLVNIPANEIYATQFFTDNLFMAGPWFVVGPTNLWGVDPGDPTHFESVTNFLIPFSALSGMDSPEDDWSAGLGQQIAGLAAAELPTNASCDEGECAPFEPASPVTGISSVDFFEWLGATLSGQEKFGLFDNWLNADFNNGSYYFNPDNPGSVDPSASSPFGSDTSLPGGTDVASGQAYGFEGFSNPDYSTAGVVNGSGGLLGGDGIPGTGAADGDLGYYMPWANTTYTFEPQTPIENFFNSLMETPSTSGLDGTGIDPIYGDPTEISQTFTAFEAGLMMFDPITPGSPFCPGDCSSVVAAGDDYPQLIADINNMSGGNNPVINEWLADYAESQGTGTTSVDGGANVPSAETIANSIALLQDKNYWDFGNAPYTGENATGDYDIAQLAPEFHTFWTDLGFNPPALYDPGAYADSGSSTSSSDITADMTQILGPLASLVPADVLSGTAENPFAALDVMGTDLTGILSLGIF